MGKKLNQSFISKSHYFSSKEDSNEQDKVRLKKINSFVKELKNINTTQIISSFSWIQITNEANFLLNILNQTIIENRILYFESLASFDSLLSIFSINLFKQLKFEKPFFKNVQRQFKYLCFKLKSQDHQFIQKNIEFQLYSIFFLLVMLIYFSGKNKPYQKKNLVSKIINKQFINNFLLSDWTITPKNERIIGLIIAYIIKNFNIKTYKDNILRFILNQFHKISSLKCINHFVYCLRQIHLCSQIDLVMIAKSNLLEQLINRWVNDFYNPDSIYIVDYICVIFKKKQHLISQIRSRQLLEKCLNFEKIDKLSVLHQNLLLEIFSRLLKKQQNLVIIQMAKNALNQCLEFDYSIKIFNVTLNYLAFNQLVPFIFPFLQLFTHIVPKKHLKSILCTLQVMKKVVSACIEQNAFPLLELMKIKFQPISNELKLLQIGDKELEMIQKHFESLISIEYQTLC